MVSVSAHTKTFEYAETPGIEESNKVALCLMINL